MLAVHDLSCIRNDRLLFSDLNFSVSAGDILHLLGENGVGKSSLLQILVGLLLPESGEVCWQGVAIHHIQSDYKRRFFYLGHKSGIKAGLTVKENLRLSARLLGADLPLDIDRLLSWFELTQLKDIPVSLLSAGQRQRVTLTRLFLSDAMLWVLDEPFTAIDQQSVVNLKNLLHHHVSKGGMVVLTNHQPLHFSDINIQQLRLSARAEQ